MGAKLNVSVAGASADDGAEMSADDPAGMPPSDSARDVVVIGASAGGVEALKAVLGALPPDYNGSICVVLHIPPSVPSVLAHILGRSTRLVCLSAYDGAPVRPGVVYVAPPDAHLLLEDGRVRLVRGPRENGHRPGIDPLFRSAAEAYGPRVVGVVLTGNLDDGTRGLQAIKRQGGLAVVQSPEDAPYPSMPQSAVEHVAVDHIAPAADIGPLLAAVARGAPVPVPAAASEVDASAVHASGVHDALDEITTLRLTTDGVPPHGRLPRDPLPGDNGRHDGAHPEASAQDRAHVDSDRLHRSADIASGIGEVDGGAKINEGLGGALSGYTCPECKGALWELRENRLVRYRCRVGHSYTEAGLVDNKARAVEDALWTAVTALEESAAIAMRVADRANRSGRDRSAASFRERAEYLEQRGAMLRGLLEDLPGHVDAI